MKRFGRRLRQRFINYVIDMEDKKIKWLEDILLMPIIPIRGKNKIEIDIEKRQIRTTGNVDPDMSDIAIEFYKVLYGEKFEISNTLESLFAGDTMNTYSTVARTASEENKDFWFEHYHCLANFWILPSKVGRSCRACNKAAGGDYMDKFLHKYMNDNGTDTAWTNRFNECYSGYREAFPRESFAEIHMIDGIYIENNKVKDFPHEKGANEIIDEMWKRIKARAEKIANDKNKKNDLESLFSRILETQTSVM